MLLMIKLGTASTTSSLKETDFDSLFRDNELQRKTEYHTSCVTALNNFKAFANSIDKALQ